MAHPFFWPTKRYFYAIGNTAAVSLTRDIDPSLDASLLLLGCGDLRNILYTLHLEPENVNRKLDFTCVDFEPAILARNTLFLSLIIDKEPIDSVFDLHLHLCLDRSCLDLLTSQCQKLIDASTGVKEWRASPYGSSICMNTAQTLSELHELWKKWKDMHKLQGAQPSAITKEFKNEMNRIHNERKDRQPLHSSRSAGPLMLFAPETMSQCHKSFWKHGTTFTSSSSLSAAHLINPTFVYTLMGGSRFSVHYGTDPMIPFHFAPLFGNARKVLSQVDVVKAARAQFVEWYSGFRRQLERGLVTIRVFFADALAACQALQVLKQSGPGQTQVPVCQWRTQTIAFEKDKNALCPVVFDVIDTSNLDDHLGILNVLAAAIPLLAPSDHHILYLESLLIQEDEAAKDFTKRMQADLSLMSLLFGLSPVDFIIGYSSHSNAHEVMAYEINHRHADSAHTQFHQVTTWKVVEPRAPCPTFDLWQLGTFLYDLYHKLFEEEDATTFHQRHGVNMIHAVAKSGVPHYCRESFVLLLKVIRDRLQIPREEWISVMDRFFVIHSADQSMNMDTVNYQDLCASLHYHRVHTMDIYRLDVLPRVGVFETWPSVPPLVRVFLTVPRDRLGVLETVPLSTPALVCGQKGPRMHNVFSSVHAAFGIISAIGPKSDPRVYFEEDKLGFQGTKPLVVSFVMPAMLLTGHGPRYDKPEDISIVLSVQNNSANTIQFVSKLGFALDIYSAKLFDEIAVLVLPERPLPAAFSKASSPQRKSGPIGIQEPVHTLLNENCDQLDLFTTKVIISTEETKRLFQSGCLPTINQTSNCAVRLSLDGITQDIYFPLPIAGPRNRLRLARKSLWIEIIVPLTDPLHPDGSSIDPFPLLTSKVTLPSPWSMHHVNLDRAPIVDLRGRKLPTWLNPHVSIAFAKREIRLRKKKEADALVFVKDSIHSIMLQAAGVQTKGSQSRQVFALSDKATNNCDTVLFVDKLRYDLSAHTVVCDTYVLPLSKARLKQMKKPFVRLVNDSIVTVGLEEGEVQSWKKLLPALAERCRMGKWNHDPDSCDYAKAGRIPLTTEIEENPLCSCGEGVDVDAMRNGPTLWNPLAKYCTRIALSPLFAVSYLEPIGRTDRSCVVCRAPGGQTCTTCQKDRYCGKVCQRQDWKRHKMKYHNIWETKPRS